MFTPKISIRIGKKGISLRSISLMTVFAILCVTIFMNAVFNGMENYGKTISSEQSKSFGEINKTLTNIDTNSKELNQKVVSITETPLTAIFFIPSAIIKAIQLSFEYVKYLWNIYTEVNKTLGLPDYIRTGLTAALIFLISYLIIDAYMRYKKT